MLIESTWIQQCIIYILLAYRSVTLCIMLEPEETTCTTRTNSSYTWKEITGANGNHGLCPHILASRLGGFRFDLLDRLFGHIKLLHVVARQQSPLSSISRSTTIDDSIDRHQRPL